MNDTTRFFILIGLIVLVAVTLTYAYDRLTWKFSWKPMADRIAVNRGLAQIGHYKGAHVEAPKHKAPMRTSDPALKEAARNAYFHTLERALETPIRPAGFDRPARVGRNPFTTGV